MTYNVFGGTLNLALSIYSLWIASDVPTVPHSRPKLKILAWVTVYMVLVVMIMAIFFLITQSVSLNIAD